MLSETEIIMVMTILNSIAHPKESIIKPCTNLWVNQTVNPFITNKNNPRVMRVTGILKKSKMGLTKKFNNPKTADTTRAVHKLSI